MSRILYGVSGEGSGHSSRALEMGRHLLEQGHELKMVSYDRGYRNLSPVFDTLAIEGLHIVSMNNRVRPLATLWHNVRRLPAIWRGLQRLRACIRDFQPAYVITDFEPCTAWLARLYRIPLISLDNQHRMRYMRYRSPLRLLWSRWITASVIRLMVPPPSAALATTYYYGELKNTRTFLFPPIIRREVLTARPIPGHHHLVYVTNHFDSLLDVLRQFPKERFVIYGVSHQGMDGNLEFKAFSSEGFVRDLATCKSVIATAGFTLISEAIYLGKPYLALPMQGQFEQQLNALCLEELGFGRGASQVSHEVLQDFFAQLPTLTARVQRYAEEHRVDDCRQANLGIRNKLDELLASGMR